MSKKHTPGPWEHKGDEIIGDGRLIALVYPEDGDKHRWYWECGEANARLIASAPDMAETIESQSAVILNLRTNVDRQAKQIERLGEAMAITAGDISEAVKDIDDMETIEARQRLIDTHKRLCAAPAETEVKK